MFQWINKEDAGRGVKKIILRRRGRQKKSKRKEL